MLHVAGFSVVMAQFIDIDHFRAVGWFNFAIGVLTIVVQFLTFHGESDWTNLTIYTNPLRSHWNSGQKCVKSINRTTFLVSFEYMHCMYM